MMINAGMAAMDNLTKKITIDKNGILISTILTWFCLFCSTTNSLLRPFHEIFFPAKASD